MEKDIIKTLLEENAELSKWDKRDLIKAINEFDIINSQLNDIKKSMLYIKRQKRKLEIEYKIKLFIYKIKRIFRKVR